MCTKKAPVSKQKKSPFCSHTFKVTLADSSSKAEYLKGNESGTLIHNVRSQFFLSTQPYFGTRFHFPIDAGCKWVPILVPKNKIGNLNDW